MAIELIPLEETHVEPTPEAPAATADVVPPKKGKGRPPGSKNKSKPEVAPPPRAGSRASRTSYRVIANSD